MESQGVVAPNRPKKRWKLIQSAVGGCGELRGHHLLFWGVLGLGFRV